MKKAFTEDLPKDLVNIAEKKRSNIFAWRGQFSPQLIESLIQSYADEGDALYDPFCGSGTLLIESALFDLKAFGTELNPAAFGLASIYKLICVEKSDLEPAIESVQNVVKNYIPSGNLFDNDTCKNLCSLKQELVLELLKNKGTSTYTILNALIIGLDFEQKKLTQKRLQSTWEGLKSKVRSLPRSSEEITVFLGDARKSEIKNNSIDFVITSPPYINVFNYHQNYRKSVEATGFNVLEVARSEIGSNRKFRSNRFLTVIQYALDIYQVFEDLRRVCKPDSKIIFVVGRESSVRKTPFSNARLLVEVASKQGFMLVGEQPRMFKNKFGQDIYEEILRFSIDQEKKVLPIDSARKVAHKHLKAALKYAPSESISDLEDAIEKYEKVEPSIIYNKN